MTLAEWVCAQAAAEIASDPRGFTWRKRSDRRRGRKGVVLEPAMIESVRIVASCGWDDGLITIEGETNDGYEFSIETDYGAIDLGVLL